MPIDLKRDFFSSTSKVKWEVGTYLRFLIADSEFSRATIWLLFLVLLLWSAFITLHMCSNGPYFQLIEVFDRQLMFFFALTIFVVMKSNWKLDFAPFLWLFPLFYHLVSLITVSLVANAEWLNLFRCLSFWLVIFITWVPVLFVVLSFNLFRERSHRLLIWVILSI